MRWFVSSARRRSAYLIWTAIYRFGRDDFSPVGTNVIAGGHAYWSTYVLFIERARASVRRFIIIVVFTRNY